MWIVRSDRLNDFLWENGLRPVWESGANCYYRTNKKFHDLLLRYDIIYTLIPNK